MTTAIASGTAPLGPTEADRSLGCERTQGRAQVICEAIEATQQPRWTGNDTRRPLYRLSTQGLKSVYCSLELDAADAPALTSLMAQSAASGALKGERLRLAADLLRRLVLVKAGRLTEGAGSVLHPDSSDYVLREPCSSKSSGG